MLFWCASYWRLLLISPVVYELVWFWKISWPFPLPSLKRSVLGTSNGHLILLMPTKLSSGSWRILLYLVFLGVFGFKLLLEKDSSLVTGFHSFSIVTGVVGGGRVLFEIGLLFRFWFVSAIFYLPYQGRPLWRQNFIWISIYYKLSTRKNCYLFQGTNT